MLEWLQGYTTAFWWFGFLSIVTFVGSLIIIPVLVARIPKDYFVRHPGQRHGNSHALPGLRLLIMLLRNILGIAFILAGLAMLVLPGQGIITILIGMMLTDFPGKHRFEQRFVRQPAVLRAMNWIRQKAQQPPLVVAERSSGENKAPV
jgi:hypothetical protein